MKALLLLSFLLLTPSTLANVLGSDPRDLAVMISLQDRSGARLADFCAAGVILSQSDDRTLVLTAYHVVSKAQQTTGTDDPALAVEFRSRRGAVYRASALSGPGLSSQTRDYAVLSVSGRLDLPRLPPDALAVVADSQWSDRTSAVRAVGNGDCRPWDYDASDRPVVSADDLEFVFESNVVHGASGGPVFSAGGDLVGLMSHSDGRHGLAKAIRPILSALIRANVEVGLRARGARDNGLPPAPRPSIAWKARIGVASWRNNPLFVGDSLFVGSSGTVWNKPDAADGVYAFGARTGRKLWTARSSADVNDLAYMEGRIVAGNDGGEVVALSATTGKMLWKVRLQGAVYAKPAYSDSGIVVATGAGIVYLLDLQTGKTLSTARVDGPVRAGLVAEDTNVFITTEAGSIYQATTFGTISLHRIATLQYPDEYGDAASTLPSLAKYNELGGGKFSVASVYAAPLVTNGHLFLGFVRQTYYRYPAVVALRRRPAADPFLWVATDPDQKVRDFGNVRFTPALFRNLLILGNPYSNAVYALRTDDGTVAWHTPLGQSMYQHWSSPVVAGARVFVARHDGSVHMLDAASGKRLWTIFLGDEQTAGLAIGTGEELPGVNARTQWNPLGHKALFATPAYSNGMLAVATEDGVLYVLNVP